VPDRHRHSLGTLVGERGREPLRVRAKRRLQEEDRLARTHRPRREDEPAHDIARTREHDVAVLDRSRFALGAVGHDEGLAVLDPDRIPLAGGGEPAAAAAP
jgi:hypothetical protein